MQFTDYTDEELIGFLRQGADPDIVEYLMVKYKPLVLSKTRMLFLTGGERDDLIQEGMVVCLKLYVILIRKPTHPLPPLPDYAWKEIFIRL